MIYSQNLEIALRIAIKEQRRLETLAGYKKDSALITGWQQALEELEKGELIIKY